MTEITIRDIARECGVGVSTVSRALNNHPDISAETRDRILEVVKRTGFVPNNSARFLKCTESNTIALIVKGMTNSFFTRMIGILEDCALNRGYMTILRHVRPTEDEVAVALSLIRDQKPRGIIFLGGDFTHDEAALRQLGVPFVFTTVGTEERETGQAPLYSNVAVDDIEMSRMAVSYLIELGHRNVAVVTEGISCPSVGRLRLTGYRRAIEEHGLPYRRELVMEVTEGDDLYTMENGYRAGNRLFESGLEITAVFCIADVLAVGLCRSAVDHGLRIPEDLSVVGFDGIEIGSYYTPSLTTVRQPVKELADASIRLLFDMIDNNSEPQNIIMSAELVIRESTAAPMSADGAVS